VESCLAAPAGRALCGGAGRRAAWRHAVFGEVPGGMLWAASCLTANGVFRRLLQEIADEFEVGFCFSIDHILVFKAEKDLAAVGLRFGRGQAEIDLDDAGGDLAGGEALGGIGFLEAPGVAFPFAIGAESCRDGAADEWDRVGDEEDVIILKVDLKIIQKADVAVGGEPEVAAFAGDGDFLGVDRDELRRSLLEVLKSFVFLGADTEALVIGERFAGVGRAILLEPVTVGGEGVVKADEDGLDIGGDIGLDYLIEEGGIVEDAVEEVDGRIGGGDGVRL